MGLILTAGLFFLLWACEAWPFKPEDDSEKEGDSDDKTDEESGVKSKGGSGGKSNGTTDDAPSGGSSGGDQTVQTLPASFKTGDIVMVVEAGKNKDHARFAKVVGPGQA